MDSEDRPIHERIEYRGLIISLSIGYSALDDRTHVWAHVNLPEQAPEDVSEQPFSSQSGADAKRQALASAKAYVDDLLVARELVVSFPRLSSYEPLHQSVVFPVLINGVGHTVFVPQDLLRKRASARDTPDNWVHVFEAHREEFERAAHRAIQFGARGEIVLQRKFF